MPRPTPRPAALVRIAPLLACAATTLASCSDPATLAAPGGSPLAARAAASATLSVRVVGLPAGAPAAVTVTGPNGFSQTLTASASLTGLRGGTYTLSAAGVTSAGTAYAPSPATQQVNVPKTGTVTATVTYSAAVTTGSLAVTVSGLPAGTAGAVTVTGPDGTATPVAGTQTLVGLAAGSYTVAAAGVTSGTTTYAASPASQTVAVTAGATASAAVAYAAAAPPVGSGLDLRIAGLYLTQGVQAMDGRVPVVANRDGVLRVFGVASAANAVRPTVRVRLYHSGVLVSTLSAQLADASTPTQVNEGSMAASWNVSVPASLVRPGLGVLADIDPANVVAEADEANNAYPAGGTPLALAVRTVADLNVRFVPVLQAATGQLGAVGDANALLDPTRRMLPVAAATADVRAAYTTNRVLGADGAGWGEVLSELYSLRTADGSARTYYGVARVGYSSGVAGIGYIGAPAALGWDYAGSAGSVMAHELGHNFNRQHAPCGGVSGADAAYPYAGGVTGAWGLDVRTGELKAPTAYDLMGYCNPSWISDYTYRAVMDFRGAGSTSTALAVGAAVEPALLVWGRVKADGELVLEPAFEIATRASLPAHGGPFTLEGTAEGGGQAFSLAFDAPEVADGPAEGERHFAFAVPVRQLGGRRLAALTLRGNGRRVTSARAADAAADASAEAEAEGQGRVRVRWDAAAHPMALVRDAQTGEVLAFARGGSARVFTDRAEVEVLVSDRVGSAGRRVRVKGR
jgi:hypothetical protein